MLTDGVAGDRFEMGAWLVIEDRDTAFDGSGEVENPYRERTHIRVPLVTFDVRITDRLGVQAAATIPDVTRTAVVAQPAGTFNFRENFSGIGDTSVIGWYRLRAIRRWYPMVNFGVSLPTGKTETPRFRPELDNGSLVPMSRLQRGSGTVDLIFGASLTKARNPARISPASLRVHPFTRTATGCEPARQPTSTGNRTLHRHAPRHRVRACRLVAPAA